MTSWARTKGSRCLLASLPCNLGQRTRTPSPNAVLIACGPAPQGTLYIAVGSRPSLQPYAMLETRPLRTPTRNCPVRWTYVSSPAAFFTPGGGCSLSKGPCDDAYFSNLSPN